MYEENDNNQYKLLLDKASDLMIIAQNDRIEYVNLIPLEEFGYDINDVSYKNIFDFIHIDDREKISEFRTKKFGNEMQTDDLIFRIINKNDSLVFVKIISMTTEWKGTPARLICIKNITDKKINELTVENSEYFLATIIDNLPDPTFVIDIKGKIFLWNKAMEKISGVKSQDIVGKDKYETVMPFDGYKCPLLVDLMSKPDAEIGKEYDFFQRTEGSLVAGRFLKSDEEEKIWVTSSILYDIRGDVIGAVESFKDMTDIKNVEEKIKIAIKEKDMLLREIHHRVRNNMQLINSMLSLQLQYVREPEYVDLFKDSINRIKTMALIHNELYSYDTYTDINFGEFVPKMINNLFPESKRQNIKIKIESEEIHFGIDDAIPCGLIIYELVSNCLKHAFPDGNGTVLIKLFYDGKTGRCNLTVSDNGKGMNPCIDLDGNIRSYGLLMVKLLSSQIQGIIRLKPGSGTEFIIDFPLKI
jgi:PAS domain S-box-containing protein